MKRLTKTEQRQLVHQAIKHCYTTVREAHSKIAVQHDNAPSIRQVRSILEQFVSEGIANKHVQDAQAARYWSSKDTPHAIRVNTKFHTITCPNCEQRRRLLHTRRGYILDCQCGHLMRVYL